MYPYIHFGRMTIPSYGLCMMFAIILCGGCIIRKAKRLRLNIDDMLILLAVTFGSGLICAALFYIAVTYSWHEVIGYIKEMDFSFIEQVGLVFYGGLIGGIGVALWTIKRLNLDMERVAVCIVPYVPLGHAIGRIGCLLAGCCHGVYCGEYIAQKYGIYYFPIQAIEAVCNLIIMIILLRYANKKTYDDAILRMYLLLYANVRFFLEFFRGDAIRGAIGGLSTAQWVSVILCMICLTDKYLLRKKILQ